MQLSMIHFMKKVHFMKKINKNHFILVFLFLTMTLQSQDYNNKWAFGIGAGGLLYSEKDGPTMGFRFSEQFPRISIARYMFKNVTFAGSFSKSLDENKKYTTLDGEIRYDFGTSENLISIYVLLGGSLVETIHMLPLVNVGAGGALWISDRFGLSGQLMYRINHLGFQSQASHIFASGGLVYRFSLNGGMGRDRRRLWDMKH